MNMFSHFIEELGLQEHTQHKLKPSDVLRINQDVLIKDPCHSKKDIAWRFLRQLLSLNPNARDSVFCTTKINARRLPIIVIQGTSPIDINMYLSDARDNNNLSELVLRNDENDLPTVHPLDVLCALLNCSDSFLQQEIVTRLSMCQFSVPLLLPAGDATNCTFMLWAMRAIMCYLPSPSEAGEVVEENLVTVPLPLFSFVRVGECKNMSKSKILNEVLSLASSGCRKDFVHRQMGCGKGSRIISNGLVDMTWYFPSKNTGSCCAPQPFAVANLHGDVRTNRRQFKFLANVSSAVFIFVEELVDCRELCNEEGEKFYFIVGHDQNDNTKQLLTSLLLSFGIGGVLMGGEETLEEKIQDIITNTTKENPKLITLTDMTALVSAIGFFTDENQMDCHYAKLHTLEMTHDILTTIQHNEKYHRSLKGVRVQITKKEKEMCQLVQQGMSNREQVQNTLHKSLLTYLWSDVITDLVYALTFMNQAQKQYFLRLMLYHHHKAYTNAFFEGFSLYDLAHIYQAEAIIMKSPEYIPRCCKLPTTAADLLLDGFPLVLMNEDTFSVHLQWINDVLTDLVNKTRGSCRVRVLSALGVYRTGKSNLLYTMFGLQFPVTRPQPTRGALMSLIKLDERFKQELVCDFLLVIDTEGLKAPKLTSAKERYEHDNSLATFIIGISDIVIFSLPAENASDTINTLQIAVCTLLRMKNLGRKPTLYFTQTNVTNASFDGENNNKGKIYDCLNETFGLAAKAIKRASFLSLKDILTCDFLNNHWHNFIPSLWQKDPFNEGINSQYAEKVMKLKQHLIHALTQESNQGSSRTMQDFIHDIKRMWNAVNLEPILKFQHIKEFISYTELSDLFREVERSIHKELSHWMSKREAEISLSHSIETLKKDMLEELHIIKQRKIENFKLYLDSDKKQFEKEFTEKFDLLSKELESFYNDKCAEMHILSHGMEKAVMEDFCNQEWDPDELEPNFDFDLYWKDKVAQLGFQILKKLDIQDQFIQILKNEMRDRGSLVTEVLNSFEKMSNTTSELFTITEKHIDISWLTRKAAKDNNHTKPWSRLDSLVELLTKKCSRYVQTLVNLNKDYEPVHCLDLLRMINKVINKETFPFTDLFEVDLKLYILTRAAAAFQETHNAHVKAKEEKLFLEKQKLPPLNALKSIIQDKRNAKRYCHLCLKPAMKRHVMSTLQPDFIRDVVRSAGAVRKSSRKSQILYLIKGCNLINIYNQISSDIDLQAKTISSTIAIFKGILKHHRELEYDDIDVLMMELRNSLGNELTQLQRDIGECPLQVAISTPQQFSSHVDFFIRQLNNELTPNADTIRILFLRVCERLFGRKMQNQHCTAPYNAGFRTHQRNTGCFTKRKHSKIKIVENRPCPKKASSQKGHNNMCNKLPPLQSSYHVWDMRKEEGAYFWKVKPAMIQWLQHGKPLVATSGRLKFRWPDTHRQIQNLACNLVAI